MTAKEKLTKVYKLESVFKRIKDWKYERNTIPELEAEGYTTLHGSSIHDTITLYHAEDTKYAVCLSDSDNEYLVLIDNTDSYIAFMQQIVPVAHMFHWFVRYAD